jgi:hypothetical protein
VVSISLPAARAGTPSTEGAINLHKTSTCATCLYWRRSTEWWADHAPQPIGRCERLDLPGARMWLCPRGCLTTHETFACNEHHPR